MSRKFRSTQALLASALVLSLSGALVACGDDDGDGSASDDTGPEVGALQPQDFSAGLSDLAVEHQFPAEYTVTVEFGRAVTVDLSQGSAEDAQRVCDVILEFTLSQEPEGEVTVSRPDGDPVAGNSDDECAPIASEGSEPTTSVPA